MKNFRLIPILFIFVFFSPYNSICQDTLKIHEFIPRKNVLRYNLTPHILGFKSAIFGYERVIKPHQTFSINAGLLSLGQSGKKENADYQITKTMSSNGWHIAVDYRFYLKRENKDPAPHGVYIAPYYSLYNFNHKNAFESFSNPNNETRINAKLNINNIGVELGYQFIIKDRFTVDMVLMGPSYSSYDLNMTFDTGFEPPDGEIDDTLAALRDILFTKYPWMKTLVDEGKIDYKGKRTHWGLGFRYVLQVGFRF